MITTDPLAEKPKKFNPDTNAQKEHFVGGRYWAFDNLISLDYRSDIISQEFSEETIERMLRDPEIKKCEFVLKDGILSDGVGFYPAIRKPLPLSAVKDTQKKASLQKEHKRYEEAKKYSDFLTRSLKKLKDKPFIKTLESMLDALFLGNKVAEKVYEEVFDPVLNREVLVVTKLKVKPRNSINMVVDNKSNLVGIRGISIVNKKREIVTLPMEKFMVLTFEEKDEDPRGLSRLEAVYNTWYLKTLVFPEYLKWLQSCAIPGLIGVMPPNSNKRAVIDALTGDIVTDSNGEPIYINNADEMLESLLQMKNNSVMVVPYEADVKPINNAVSGDPFRNMVDFLNKEMEMALLLQTLATSDSRHNTRAASQTHITVLDQHIFRLKEKVIQCILQYYVKPMLELNFPDYDEELIPRISMGDTERRNWVEEASAATNMWSSGYMSKSQRIGMDFQLGLDERGDDDEDPTYEKPNTTSNPNVEKV